MKTAQSTRYKNTANPLTNTFIFFRRSNNDGIYIILFTVYLITQIPLTLLSLFVSSITFVHSQNGVAGGFYECYEDQKGNKKACGLYDDTSFLCENLSSTEKQNCVCGAVNFYLPTVSPEHVFPTRITRLSTASNLLCRCLCVSLHPISRCIAISAFDRF